MLEVKCVTLRGILSPGGLRSAWPGTTLEGKGRGPRGNGAKAADSRGSKALERKDADLVKLNILMDLFFIWGSCYCLARWAEVKTKCTENSDKH